MGLGYLNRSIFSAQNWRKVLIGIILPWQFSCMMQASISKKDESSQIGKAAKLVFQMEPSGGLTGEVWPQQPTIMIVDEQGNLVVSGPDAFAPVTVSILNESNSILGKTTISAEKGIAKFTDLNASVIGLKQLVATKQDLSASDGQASLSTTSVPFVITANKAAKLSLTSNSTITAGNCAPVDVMLNDQFGNPTSTTATVNFELYGNGSGSFFSDTNCGTATTSGQITPSTSSTRIYYKNNFQEKLNLGVYDPSAKYSATSTAVSIGKSAISKFTIRRPTGNPDTVGCALYVNGSVYCSSQVITLPYPAVDITSGDNFNCALLTNASVYCWGLNNTGQLGQGNLNAYSDPVLVNLGGPATQVSSGSFHTCAIATISSVPTLKCWGGNVRRQIGDGTLSTRSTPVIPSAVTLPGGVFPRKLSVQTDAEDGATKNFLILTDGTVWSWGDFQAPAQVSGLSNVAQIASDATSGTATTCALLSDQTVQCFGSNLFGQYGNGTTTSSATPINITEHAGSIEIAVSSGQLCSRKTTNNQLYCSGSTNTYDSFTKEAYEFPRLTPRQMFSGNKFRILISNFSLTCGLSDEADPQILCFRSRLYLQSNPYIITALPSPLSIQTSPQTKMGLLLTSNESAVIKDECFPLTLSFQKNGSIAPAESQIEFTLSDSQGLGQFYSSSTCAAGTEIVQGYFPVGLVSRTIYLKNTTSVTSPRWTSLLATASDPVIFSGFLGLTYSGPLQEIRIGNMTYTSDFTEYYAPLRFFDTDGNRVTTTSSQNMAMTSSNYPALGFLNGPNGTILPNDSTLSIPANSSMVKLYIAVAECQGGNATVSIPSLNVTQSRHFDGECYTN